MTHRNQPRCTPPVHIGEFGSRYGRVGTTALNVLTLAVYYRDPAVYKGGKPARGQIENK